MLLTHELRVRQQTCTIASSSLIYTFISRIVYKYLHSLKVCGDKVSLPPLFLLGYRLYEGYQPKFIPLRAHGTRLYPPDVNLKLQNTGFGLVFEVFSHLRRLLIKTKDPNLVILLAIKLIIYIIIINYKLIINIIIIIIIIITIAIAISII